MKLLHRWRVFVKTLEHFKYLSEFVWRSQKAKNKLRAIVKAKRQLTG